MGRRETVENAKMNATDGGRMTLQPTNEHDDDIEFRPQFAAPGEVN